MPSAVCFPWLLPNASRIELKRRLLKKDGHEFLTGGGLSIYGLSSDSPKSNTTFKTKQSLPYSLICNSSYSLIGAIGLQQGAAKKTKRGVWAVDKSGKVLLSFAGGPVPTVDAVKKLVDSLK